jgi:uncharacterized protein
MDISGGSEKTRKTPIRSCVACRNRSPKNGLVRVVRGADGAVRYDSSGKQPGRGAYLCRSIDCCRAAIKTRKLERALKCELSEETVSELVSVFAEDNGE